jgi:hypothetical protein
MTGSACNIPYLFWVAYKWTEIPDSQAVIKKRLI